METYLWFQAAKGLRFQINVLDGKFEEEEKNAPDSTPETLKKNGTFKAGQISMGSPEKPCFIEQIEAKGVNEPAFQNFLSKFHHFLQQSNDPLFHTTGNHLTAYTLVSKFLGFFLQHLD